MSKPSDKATAKKFDTVKLTQNGLVAKIELSRPDALNSFNRQMRRELLLALQAVNEDEQIRAVIVSGAGKGFSTGADLKETLPEGQTVQQRLEQEYKPCLVEIANSPKPFIASVKGPAAGIGAAFVLACDLVVMSRSAYLLQAFSAIGLVPDGGMSWQLFHQLGAKWAYEIIALGEKLPAEKCLQLGLANRISEDEKLEMETEELARQLVKRAPLSLTHSKKLIHQMSMLSFEQAISLEAQTQMITNTSEDHAEGKRAFLEKRTPQWKGR